MGEASSTAQAEPTQSQAVGGGIAGGNRGPGRQRTRYLITTLIDHRKYPWDEIASLYLHRGEIELRFRDIKTTMGMALLRTKSPEMVHKEVLMHMIAYNVVRLLMLKADNVHGVNHRRLSFKGVLQVLEECRSGFGKVAGKPRHSYFEYFRNEKPPSKILDQAA